jgi:3-hydroxybutyryl-CoA dehydrogenase
MQQTGIRNICICGAGTMGSGIAQVTAQHGFDTIVYDVDGSTLEQAKSAINQKLGLLVEKNKISAEEKKATLSRLYFTSDIAACKAELIIEAIVEKYEAKTKLFSQLTGINSPETIFATNTSSLSVSQIASHVAHPERVVGMHFFNPAPAMKLVEVVKGSQTTDVTVEAVFTVAQQIDKIPVLCKDAPGFIVNHVARPYYIESLRLIEEGLSDLSTIDMLLESTGFKMGPFKLMDLIGNDINFAVSCSVYEQLGQPQRLKPSFLQEEKVNRAEFGKKSGKGYYRY